MAEILPLCSMNFQKEIKRYANWQDSQKSLLGRLLLKTAMKVNNIPFQLSDIHYNTFGKPLLKNNKTHFNISHSGDKIVCAVSKEYPVGIDIEKIRNIDYSEFKSQLTTLEFSSLEMAVDKTLAFFNLWTKKEAVLKAHGSGLSTPLASFELSDDQTEIDKIAYHVKEIYIEQGYQAHLALNHPLTNISIESKKLLIDYHSDIKVVASQSL